MLINMQAHMNFNKYGFFNILNHLIGFDTYGNFVDAEDLNKYIEDSADIILGFYED